MPRDASGIYSLPAGTAAVNGEVIDPDKFNQLTSDIETNLNTNPPLVTEISAFSGVSTSDSYSAGNLASYLKSLKVSGQAAGLARYNGAYIERTAGKVSWYFQNVAFTLAPQVFKRAERLAALEIALNYGVVQPRQSSGEYGQYAYVRYASGKVFFANISAGGTWVTAGSEPSDTGATTAGDTVVDGDVTMEFTGVTLPTSWDYAMVDIASSFDAPLTPDSNDAYAGMLAAAIEAAAPTIAWLNADTVFPNPSGSGFLSRMELLDLVISNSMTDELQAAGSGQLARTFQGGVDAAGAAYTTQFLADNVEVWRGYRAQAALHTQLGNTSEATAASGYADSLKLGIISLWDASAGSNPTGRFKTFASQTDHADKTGDSDFVTNFRFHLWPLLHGMWDTLTETQTYVDPVIEYTKALTPNIWGTGTTLAGGGLDSFVIAEWFYAMGTAGGHTGALNVLLQRTTARTDAFVVVSDAALAVLAAELPLRVTDHEKRLTVIEATRHDASEGDAAALTAALASANHLIVSPGTHEIDANVTIPAGVTIEFQNGAIFKIASGVSITWNGGLVAGPYQQIFTGDLAQGAYTRIGSSPYIFALKGSPRIDWASPRWFGAAGDVVSASDGAISSSDATLTSAGAAFAAGDVGKVINVAGAGAAGAELVTTIASVTSATEVELTDAASTTVSGAAYFYGTDDQAALHCAQYFGGRMYVPEGEYLTTVSLHQRQDDQALWGDGGASVIKASGPNLGQVIAWRGDPPTTASGDPARYVERATVRDIMIDGADATNNNGIGGSHCRGCRAQDVYFRNIGRKALTLQFHCVRNIFDNITIYDSVQETGGTTSALTLEGQEAGLNYSLDGGVASANDLQGADVFGNLFTNITMRTTGNRFIQLGRCINNTVRDCDLGDVTGGGAFVYLAEYASENLIDNVSGGDSARYLIHIETNADRNTVSNWRFGDNTSTLSDGYSIEVVGDDNKIVRGEFDHSNTAVSQAVLVTGARTLFDGVHMKSNDAGTGFAFGSAANSSAIVNCRLGPSPTRAMNITSDDVRVQNNYVDGSTSATGIQCGGARPIITGNTVTGDGTFRIYIDGTEAAPYAVVTNNILPGSSPQINFNSATSYSSVKSNNPGDTNSGDNTLLGAGTTWLDANGHLRVLTSGVRTSDTDGAVIGNQTFAVTLADDAATSIAIPADSGLISVASTVNIQDTALFFVDAGASAAVRVVDSGTVTTVTTGALTGTTGSDTQLTIGVATGLLYIENRRGGPRTFRITFMGTDLA